MGASTSQRLAGKVAIVTGIESEIGVAIAERFVAEGAKVGGCIGSGQREAVPVPAENLALCILEGDLCSNADSERIVNEVVARYGRLDVLVNYAAALRVVGMTSETILGQMNTAEDVAAATLFFASDDAARITGALLPVDAGRSLPRF